MQQDRVTPAEAARQLGCNRATVGRWVKKNEALTDENGLVSVEELRRFRAEVVNPANATRGPATGDEPQTPRGPSMNDHRARRERAQADEAELDLADRLGRTLDRRQVEIAVGDAVDAMRQAALQAARDRAEALSRITDPREMERALTDFLDVALSAAGERLAAELTEAEADAA